MYKKEFKNPFEIKSKKAVKSKKCGENLKGVYAVMYTFEVSKESRIKRSCITGVCVILQVTTS